MDILQSFKIWMRNNSTLKESSISKYSGAIKTISNDMITRNIIHTSLFSMNLYELDSAIFKILNDSFFQQKNSIGNKMYSNAIKQFRYFILDGFNQDDSEIKLIETISTSDISFTEKDSIIKARTGQGQYRINLLKKYENKCVVTGIDKPNLLIASHIKPWSICNNLERLDTENGLLLCPNMDKLFDSGLITFSNKGRMKISSFIGKENEKRLNISSDIIINLRHTNSLLEYLEYHRDTLFVK